MTDEINNTDAPINIDEEEMEITLHLNGRIAVYVYEMSKQMGLCPQEYLRFIIGQVVTEGLFIPGTDMDAPMPPPMDAPSADATFEAGVDRMMGAVRYMMAGVGQLTCNQCTQRLSVEDVKRGHCNHCEFPING